MNIASERRARFEMSFRWSRVKISTVDHFDEDERYRLRCVHGICPLPMKIISSIIQSAFSNQSMIFVFVFFFIVHANSINQ